LKRPAQRPVVITDAERSQNEQLRAREIRYVIMMGTRLLCLITGGVLVGLRPPLLPLWLSLCVGGAVVLPWLAVILANDRAPKPEHRLGHNRGGAPPQPPPGRAVGSAPEPKVIDADS
jgi:hypothetical protein